MPSSPTARNRFQKQGTGENTNTWGTILNTGAFDLVDEALDGFESIAVTGNLTLTSTNFVSDQARKRFLKFTGSVPATITIPSVSKLYFIWNATSEALTVSTGGDSVANLASGAKQWVACDGVGVYTDTSAPIAVAGAASAANSAANADADAESAAASATTATTAATSATASATSASNSATAAAQSAANAAASSGIPSQTGNAGKFLTTNGTTASWGTAGTAWTLLSSTTVNSGVSSIAQTGLANYSEVVLVINNIRQQSGSAQSLTLATSTNNGSSYGGALGVTGSIASNGAVSVAAHVLLTANATMIVPANISGATPPNPAANLEASKTNALSLQWSAGTISSPSTGTISFYAR